MSTCYEKFAHCGKVRVRLRMGEDEGRFILTLSLTLKKD
jgi:hypothetical protein